MINRIVLLSMACLTYLGFTACEDDLTSGQYIEQTLEVEVLDRVSNSQPATKVVYTGFQTTFENDDAIGVYVYNPEDGALVLSNIKYWYSNGKWITSEVVPYKSSYEYYAYFPYKGNPGYSPDFGSGDAITGFSDFMTDVKNVFWKADQSNKANYDACNLMGAKGVKGEQRKVTFVMDHLRGLAVINSVTNQYYFKDNPETLYYASLEFTGSNKPLAIEDKFCFLMKPDSTLNIGGIDFCAGRGEYLEQSCGIMEKTYTKSYMTSTNGGNSFSTLEYAPAWLTVTPIRNGDKPMTYEIEVTDRITSWSIISEESAPLSFSSEVVNNRDLSLYDCAGNYTGVMNTANCYLVHNAGTYKIPLVYGNAVKDGQTNERAYISSVTNSSTKTSYIKEILVNHKDMGVIDPWIKNNHITISSAKLVWQDVQGLISNVGIDGDHLTFTVSQSNITEGNALVAAVDNDGLIAWSWHIWVTPETLENCQTISTGSHDYNVAPVNLGWVNMERKNVNYLGAICKIYMTSEDKNVRIYIPVLQNDISLLQYSGYCPFYQWGKPIPEPPSNGIDNTTHTVWDINGDEVTLAYRSTSASIGTNIQNPLNHYFNNSTNSPYKEKCCNYWDINQSVGSNVKTATNKTIYDPCPPGFCVPTDNLYCFMGAGLNSPTGYSSSSDYNWNSTLRGKTWSIKGQNIFFPAAGYRQYNSVSLYSVGASGYVWSASPGNSDSGRYMSFDSSYWNWNYGQRSRGYAVRPVQE